jgi:hypothetical protein
MDDIFTQIRSRQVLIVNSKGRNGLLLHKTYHTEFAGPGAAVGGIVDQDCQQVELVGNVSLVLPESMEALQRAYAIRRQWIRLEMQLTRNGARFFRG